MAYKPMYPGLANSPETTLAAGINETAVTIPITDIDDVPAAPNVIMLGTGEETETVYYTGKVGNSVTGCTRGFDGTTARAWDSGTVVARRPAAYDLEALQNNIIPANLDALTMAAPGDLLSIYDISEGVLKKIDLANWDRPRKNLIINGNFDIWQRGTSFTTIGRHEFRADRWCHHLPSVETTSPPGITHTRIDANGELPGSQYYFRMAFDGAGFVDESSAGQHSVDSLYQTIENGVSLLGNGHPVVFSMYARSNIPGKRISMPMYISYGSGGSPGIWSTGGKTFELTPQFTKYVVVFPPIPVAGKTIRVGNQINVYINSAWGSAYLPRVNTDTCEDWGGEGYIDIAQVQLNIGDKPLPFSPRLYAEELALCQRYYRTWTQQTENGRIHIPLWPPMRVAPTMTASAGTISNITAAGFNLTHNAQAATTISADSEL